MSNHPHDEERDLHFEQIQHSDTQYESRDLGTRTLVGFVAGLGLMTFAMVLVAWGVLAFLSNFVNRERAENAPPPLTAMPQEPRKGDPALRFPEPRLEKSEAAESRRTLAANEAQLSSYGWVDQKNGVAHIPIERAMDQIAQQGLPTRPQPKAQPPAEFGSGIENNAGAGGGYWPEVRN
ncbi:MAG TPA: hypothetical protein VEG30_07820 [Terriglobales bacterium]|nr:hypothetical protein [Terriglobales bacterium]